MKKGLMTLFAVLLMLMMMSAAFAYVVWSDNFNDNSLNPVWTNIKYGYGYTVEQNQRIEMCPYFHYPEASWMSEALQLANTYALSTGRHTTIIIPVWYDVQEVTFCIHNNQYGAGEHDRYTIRWHNCWNDGTGSLHVDREKDGQKANLYSCSWRNGHWGLPYYSPYNQWIYGRTVAVGMQIKRESSNDVHFWWGEHIIFKNAQGQVISDYWDWWLLPVTDEGGDIDWIFSSNYVWIAFNTYNSHPDHELGVAYFDDFDIATD